uniref:BTB/POZ domain-containing protein 7-like n=1 Tax=Myxine glutinosa TaxID=7769 RepID=UPI00358FF23B
MYNSCYLIVLIGVHVIGVKLEGVKTFCYLGDMLNGEGGSDSATVARVRCAWKKFWELNGVPIRRYGRSLLHFLYTDCLDLHLVEAGPVGLGFDRLGSLKEVQAMVSGVSTCHSMEQAMELCHIARLLEIDILIQACEDELVAMLSIERLPSLLAWSSRGHGSDWVHRQALLFLCEEFSSIATSPALFQLSQDALLEALDSEYTQASEADILKAVVRWGEHQLLKRMEEREPNALNGTAHSMARRSARRRDLDHTELLELISPLLSHVRQDHIVPPTHDAFASAVKRGLITRPATQAMVVDRSPRGCPWIQAESDGPQFRPRLYMSFVEEAKAVLQERMAEHTDLVRLRLAHSSVPNTLHICATPVPRTQPEDPPSTPRLALVDDVPVPSPMAICSMLRRQHELQRSSTAIQACTLNPGRAPCVIDLIQRQVLREHGLPDRVSELLQNPNKFYSEDVLITAVLTVQPTKSAKLRSSFLVSPPLPATSAEVAPLFPPSQEQALENNSSIQSHCAPTPGSAGQFHSCPFYLPNTIENGDCVTLTGNDSAAPDTTPTQDCSNESIPDIAMAASSLGCILAGDKLSASSLRSNCCSGNAPLHTHKQNAFSLNMKPYFGEVIEERSGFVSRSIQVKPSRSALYETKDQLSRGLGLCETCPGSKRHTVEMCGHLPAVDILATSRNRLPESQTDLLLGHVLGPTDRVSGSPSIESSLEEIQTLLERSHIFGSTQVDGAAIRMLEPSFKKSAL